MQGRPRAGQRGNSEAHCGLYTQHTSAWKTETLSGTEIGLTYVDDHAVENCWSPKSLAWPAFWKEKENQVAADSVYDKEMVQEKLQTMEGFQEEQQEAPTDAAI